VPDYAQSWYFVRDIGRESVEDIYSRVIKCAEGAALMTGTTMEVNLITGTYPYLPNHELSRLLAKNMQFVGAPDFSEEDQAFGKAMQRHLDIEEKGFSTDVEEYSDEETRGGGSTDVADVSWLIPTSGEMNVATMPEGIPWHSWAVASSAGSQAGIKAMIVAGKTMAASVVEVMMDTKIAERAKTEFDEKTEGFTYKSAVPMDQNAPSTE